MTNYDVLFIHPPAIYDFRQRTLFPGALGTTVEQVQFTKVPIGLLSLAGYLDKHGYKVLIDNLGDRMVNSPAFNPEQHLKNLSASLFAIGLHFQQHAQGAIETARLCKKLHPGSLVVLGGLTATRFHEEIIRKYEFVDAVIRGEAEMAFLEFVRAFERNGKITATPNLTFRAESAWHRAADLSQRNRDIMPESRIEVHGKLHEESQGEGSIPSLRGTSTPPWQSKIHAIDTGSALSATQPTLDCFGVRRSLAMTKNTADIIITPLMPPVDNLDEFDFIRFDLLEPKTSIFSPDALPRWSLEVCRGCVYNCSICGGSAYAYKTYLGREKPAFRSPGKIIEDIKRLTEQGIRIVGLYQDPRMGGEEYWRGLLAALRREKPDIDRLSLDLLVPADEEFIREAAGIGKPVTVHICPDTGCDNVRRLLGRHYSSQELLETVKLCHKYLIPVTSFFSAGLAGETPESVRETLELAEKLASSEQIMLARSNSWGLGSGIPLGGPIIGPIVLDPGSQAFDNPEKYGYKLLYKDLEEYISGLSGPSWHQWINYETSLMTKKDIIGLILQSMAFSIDAREEYGFCSHAQAGMERLKLKADIMALNEIDRIMSLPEEEREKSLRSLKEKIEAFLRQGAIKGGTG